MLDVHYFITVAHVKNKVVGGRRVAPRLVLLVLGAVCLLAGLDAALLRLGAWAPLSPAGAPTPQPASVLGVAAAAGDGGGAGLVTWTEALVSPVADTLAVRLPTLHGPAMLVGFMGAVISLERAVAARAVWAYAAPALQALGVLALLAGAPAGAGIGALLVGALVLGAVYARTYRWAPSAALDVEAMGAVALLLGDLTWLAAPVGGVPAAVPLWLLFPVLTVVGERLELARVAFLEPAVEHAVRGLALTVLLAACALALTPTAHLVLGPALAALAVVMAWYDVARRTVRGRGVVRFAAACMLAGYAWLGAGGIVWSLCSLEGGVGAAYEVVVHALALGFAFSMILAHAPTIVPAIVHRRLPYHRMMWLPAVLLHGGLVVRVAGLASGLVRPWRLGGVLGVVAVLGFLAVSLGRAAQARAARAPA